jgi:prepilin-type N-terminal cleavage/methylation domain-containing protein
MFAATSSLRSRVSRRSPHLGFTLIELLVVIAIIGILIRLATNVFDSQLDGVQNGVIDSFYTPNISHRLL